MIKILVIEPNPQRTLDLFKSVFFQQTITVVENLAEALTLVQAKPFDVVFLSQATAENDREQAHQIIDKAKLLITCESAQSAVALLADAGLEGVVLYPHQKQALRNLLGPLNGLSDLTESDGCTTPQSQPSARTDIDNGQQKSPVHLPLATQAIEVTLRSIEESDSSGKHLLANLPEIFSHVSEQLKYENQLIASLACRLLPIGFTVLATEEIDCIRTLRPEDPFFQLAVRRAFLSAARMTDQLQLLRPISDCFRLAPFATGQLIRDRDKDLASILHVSTVWAIGQAIGLNAPACKEVLERAFPSLNRRLRSAFHSLPRYRVRESVIPFSQLKSGMVIKQDLRFKAGALLLSADTWIDDEVFQQISGEIQQNSTKNVLVVLDSLTELDQRKFKEVYYINEKKKELLHSRCEIVSQVKIEPEPK